MSSTSIWVSGVLSSRVCERAASPFGPSSKSSDADPEGVPDVEWLEHCGRAGWIVFSKDKRLRHDRDQRAMMIEHNVRAFVLTSGNLKAPEQAARFLQNLARIESAARSSATCIYAVHKHHIERLWPL